jgi:hypothetical protein
MNVVDVQLSLDIRMVHSVEFENASLMIPYLDGNIGDLICPCDELINYFDDGLDGMLSQAVDTYCSDGKILIFLSVWDVRTFLFS